MGGDGDVTATGQGGAEAVRRLAARAGSLPDRPGVYLFRGEGGRVLYVGKAASLRERVRSYFRGGAAPEGKVRALVDAARDLEFIATDSEVEALILECNLIKEHRPPFNVRLRDDKSYPYLRITLQEPWPRVLVARGRRNDGARYFGPYPHAQAVHETLRLLRRVFPHRDCSDARFRRHRDRPCLHHHLGRCPGPCAGLCTPEEYASGLRGLVQFLEGKDAEVLAGLRRRMEEAAAALRFEEAARLRDRIQALEAVRERQKMVSRRFSDYDVVALALPGDEAAGGTGGTGCAHVFLVREGRLVGRDAAGLAEVAGEERGEVLAAFLEQYYGAGDRPVPPEIVVEQAPAGAAALAAWLGARRGGRVTLTVPARGEKRQLLDLARRNASLALAQESAAAEAARPEGTLRELAATLGLSAPPRRIECYDVSNLQGREAVAAMVVFVDGRPARHEYRRFRVRTVAGPDDYAMMREVLGRRFARADWPRPDLVLVDGGRGQLSVARRVLEEAGLGAIPAFGLAKEDELVFAAGRPEPLVLSRRSPALRLLQRLRDEAHRFAVGYHRRVHRRESIRSVLEDVPGIGPRRRRALLARFGSLEGMRRATVEQLAAVPGMNRTVALELHHFLHELHQDGAGARARRSGAGRTAAGDGDRGG